MKFGPYHIVDVAGRGGSGTVFRAKAPDGSTVAVKTLRTLDEATYARFDRERRIIEGLTPDAGFVPLLDAGSSTMGPYIVMPYLGGGTLRDRLRSGALPVDETLEIARSVARALGAAHERGIVHRDLKPENLLYDEQGRLYVSDVGLSKHFRTDVLVGSQSVALSGADELRGTVVYIPPEQLVESRTVGPAGDVFSLGLILWECLAGRAAYVAPTIAELLHARTVPIPPVAAVRPDVPAWLATAIDKATAPDPALRHEDGYAFARALAGPRSRAPSRVLFATLLLALPAVAAIGTAAYSALKERMAAPVSVRPPAPKPGKTVDPKIAEADREEKLGDEAAAARKSDEAIAHFSRVIELDPTRARAYRKRAEQENGLSRFSPACADARRAIELDPRDAHAFFARAWARGALHDGTPEEHLADYEHAVRLDPSYAGAYLGRALGIAAIAPRDPRVLQDLDHCLELAPDLELALFNRALHRDLAGRSKEALADISRAIERNPAPFYFWRQRATVRLHLGDFRGASEDATQALQREPGDDVARNVLVEARKRLGR